MLTLEFFLPSGGARSRLKFPFPFRLNFSFAAIALFFTVISLEDVIAQLHVFPSDSLCSIRMPLMAPKIFSIPEPRRKGPGWTLTLISLMCQSAERSPGLPIPFLAVRNVEEKSSCP